MKTRGFDIGLVAIGVAVVLTCCAQRSGAQEMPPAADTYAVDGSSVTEVDAFLEAHYQTVLFLQAHQVGRYELLANCESGSQWGLNAAHDGALQFSPRTWVAMGGRDYAAFAYQAEPWQQADIADRLVAYEQAHGRGGWGPWPSCARRLGLPR